MPLLRFLSGPLSQHPQFLYMPKLRERVGAGAGACDRDEEKEENRGVRGDRSATLQNRYAVVYRSFQAEVRLKTYASAKRRLDAVFSQYIRRKNADSQGNCRCVSCGVERHWKELQCGHFVSRVHLALRWDEKNCHPQCPKCNVLLRGNAVGYARFLEERFGPSVFAELDERRKVSVKFTKADLIEIIKDYEQKLGEL